VVNKENTTNTVEMMVTQMAAPISLTGKRQPLAKNAL
jgi:hypothetical protein